MIDKIFPKLHNEGYKFLVIFGLATLVLYLINGFLGLIGIVLTVWVYYFFRDPDRVSIKNNNFLVSPADGLITEISEINGPEELGLESKKFTRISIFMNVFNCHVNRLPFSGKIKKIFYKPGKFLNASLDKASDDNERNYVIMNNSNGTELVLVQIAGLIARRIVCESSENQEVEQGSRIGMIRFGSRADVYYENYEPLVKIGQTAVSGETLIAKK